jgi:hypothetical protein
MSIPAFPLAASQGLDYGRPRINLPFGLIFLLACIFEYLVGRSFSTFQAFPEMASVDNVAAKDASVMDVHVN